jgi:Mrp family chromosome partitioning ATPase
MLADGVLVVADLEKITRGDIARLRDQLSSLDAEVIGIVANRAPRGRELSGYHHRSGWARVHARLRRTRLGEPDEDGSRGQEISVVGPAGGGERLHGRDHRID